MTAFLAQRVRIEMVEYFRFCWSENQNVKSKLNKWKSKEENPVFVVKEMENKTYGVCVSFVPSAVCRCC